MNQLNRLHISLENRLTPQNLFELFDAFNTPEPGFLDLPHYREEIENRLKRLRKVLFRSGPPKRRRRPPVTLDWSGDSPVPVQGDEWLLQLRRWMYLSGVKRPEEFRRVKLQPGVTYYSAGGEAGEKTLLVCMPGKEGRMMLPLPVFLQNLDAATADVLVITDPTRNAYREGLGSAGNDLFSMIDSVGERISEMGHARRVAIGVSAGGVPAVTLALRLGFERALGIGSRSPDDPLWVDYTGQELARQCMPDWYREQLDAAPGTEVLLVFGADYEEDRVAASAFRGIYSAATLVEVRSMNPLRRITHNVFYLMLNRASLRKHLRKLTQPEFPPGPPGGGNRVIRI